MEHKTLGEQMVEEVIRRERWRSIRIVVFTLCMVTIAVALAWIAAGQ